MIHTSSAKEAKVPYHVVMDVTPEMAFKWLEANTRNRPLSQAHIQRLACDMRNDRWLLTHQGIAFDIYGLLLDGQHRLWAVIEADKPVTMRVFFDEPCESRKVLDTGERRSNLDVLAISSDIGIVTTRHLATLRAMLAGLSSPSIRLTPGEEGEHFRRHRNAIAFAVTYAGAGGMWTCCATWRGSSKSVTSRVRSRKAIRTRRPRSGRALATRPWRWQAVTLANCRRWSIPSERPRPHPISASSVNRIFR